MGKDIFLACAGNARARIFCSTENLDPFFCRRTSLSCHSLLDWIDRVDWSCATKKPANLMTMTLKEFGDAVSPVKVCFSVPFCRDAHEFVHKNNWNARNTIENFSKIDSLGGHFELSCIWFCRWKNSITGVPNDKEEQKGWCSRHCSTCCNREQATEKC